MTPAEAVERGRGLDRVLAFSDGVFAIAITLLVLNLRVAHLSGANLDHRLLHALGDDGGVLVGFVISFYVIARYWMAHHWLSLVLRRVDTRFIVINLAFLAFIVFLPFPTEILGLYGGTVTGVVFYAGTMVVVALLSGGLWEYGFRWHLTDAPVGPAFRRQARMRAAVPLVVFATSIPIAFARPAGHGMVGDAAHPTMGRGAVRRGRAPVTSVGQTGAEPEGGG